MVKAQLVNSQENEELLKQQAFTLQGEFQVLENQLKDQQYSIDSLRANLEFLSNENEQLKQQNNLLNNTTNDLTNQLDEFKRQSSSIESQDLSKQTIQKHSRSTPIQEVCK